MGITSTAIGIPLVGGHSEAINIEFQKDFEMSDIRKLFQNISGVAVQDNPGINTYPMPIYAEVKSKIC
tara:strand:- start:2507 stop:2710 length:204 start_codon:yes stop_codon:yes gene_type:complete